MTQRLCVVTLLLALVAVEARAVTYTRVSVANTATLLYTAPNSSVGRVLVRNPSAVSVYVGDISVTTATGFEIAAGDSLGINLFNGDKLYGIVAGANQTMYLIQGVNPQ